MTTKKRVASRTTSLRRITIGLMLDLYKPNEEMIDQNPWVKAGMKVLNISQVEMESLAQKMCNGEIW